MQPIEEETHSTLKVQTSFDSDKPLQPPQSAATGEYDPCANAKPCSPFYLYKHDSPRPSMEASKFKTSIQVSEQDLELGEAITPTITQEKIQLQKTKTNTGPFRLWKKKCLRTTPKQKGRIARLPKKQRIMARALITFLVVGCMIGIAVGIAAGLKSGVWKSNNQQSQIGHES